MEKSLKKMSDQELVGLFIAGDENAFCVLLDRYKGKIFSVIFLIVKDKEVAEDLFQDVMLKVVRLVQAGKYNEEGKFLPWVTRIARNLSIDHFRKGKRVIIQRENDKYDIFYNIAQSEPNAEQKTIKDENARLVNDLIQQLPDSQKEVLIMRHYGDLSFKEIADLTQVSINTALGRMRYALINMRRMMGLEVEEAKYGKKIHKE